jgi:hypothetical protein
VEDLLYSRFSLWGKSSIQPVFQGGRGGYYREKLLYNTGMLDLRICMPPHFPAQVQQFCAFKSAIVGMETIKSTAYCTAQIKTTYK